MRMKLKSIILVTILFIVQSCNQAEKVEYEYSTIPMIPDGSIYRMPCEINGLPLKFIFDTGASDVSISKTEAIFMIKNDFIEVEDLKDKVSYSMANGDIQEGVELLLKEVKVGDIILNNVSATIVDNDNAPILLGQSVLNQLGVLIVDYSKNEMSFIKGEFNVGSLISEHNSTNELQQQNDALRQKISNNSEDFQSEKSSLNERLRTQRKEMFTLRSDMTLLEEQITKLKQQVSTLQTENKKLKKDNEIKRKSQSKSTRKTSKNTPPPVKSETTTKVKPKSTVASSNKENSENKRSRGGYSVPKSYTKLTTVKYGPQKLYKSIQGTTSYFDDVDMHDDVYIINRYSGEMSYVMVRGVQGYMRNKNLK